MNVLIVENEQPAAASLSRLLKKIDGSISISGVTESVEVTINWLQANAVPDLIFMDIQLDDGLCFEIFETMKLDTPVIFTTAYNEYTLSAFKVNSVDYLLKPIEELPLRNAIDKFRSLHYRNSVNNELLNRLVHELNTGYKTRFLVRIGVNYRSVPVNEISCFYILERATFMRTFADNDYAIDHSLDYLQRTIDPARFFRINRNSIINIDAVGEILSYSSSRLKVKLTGHKPLEDLIVSRDKVGDFKKWIDR